MFCVLQTWLFATTATASTRPRVHQLSQGCCVGRNRLKWNDVQVHDMEFTQQELAYVTNEVCLSWALHMSMVTTLGLLLLTTMLAASNAPEP